MCWTLVDISSDYWALRKFVQTEFSAMSESAMGVNLGRAMLFYFSLFVPRCVVSLQSLRVQIRSPAEIWISHLTGHPPKASFLRRTLSRGVSQSCVSRKHFFFAFLRTEFMGQLIHDVGTFQLMRLVRVCSLRKSWVGWAPLWRYN